MANVLSTDERLAVIHHLVEGCSLRSITRLTGIHRTTSINLMLEFGDNCREFLDREMRGLNLRHVQGDEIWTFVQKKQGRLKDDEKENPLIGDMYLWVALDEDTKLIPSFVIGKRSADMARRFTRLSLGFSKKLDNLAAAVAVYIAYYNYCWRPRLPGKTGRRRVTPAMAAGVTDSLWTLPVLYGQVMR